MAHCTSPSARGAEMDAGLRHRRLNEVQQLLEATMEDEARMSRQLPSPPSPLPTRKPLLTTPMQSPMSVHATPRACGGDEAAGTRKVSLSDPGLLTSLCCCVPFAVFSFWCCLICGTAIYWQHGFYLLTAMLTVYSVMYSANLTFSGILGAWRMRRAVTKNWHALLKQKQEESPETSEIMHIAIIPNYKEDEDMLLHTVENLARSAMALGSIHVVLAMEEREGQVARDKAERLIQKTSHLFADIFATFHPANVPGDVPGKSSNDQWAYRMALQRLAPKVGTADASLVFISCLDADTLHHPQYFSALAYQGLCMPKEERSWTIWQTPNMPLRNIFSPPVPTRIAGYAALLYELSSMTNQTVSPHFAYSAYSMTLSLASHHLVGGWDSDVIAEDWHMSCKCHFASIWEQLEALEGPGTSVSCQERSAERSVKSRYQIQPVYLPAINFLVESDEGWWASVYARFVQARRHSQGLAELSYLLVQYWLLLTSKLASRIAWSEHFRILAMAMKMCDIHVTHHFQALALLMTTATLLPSLISWVLSLSLQQLFEIVAARSLDRVLSLQSFEGLRWLLCTIFGPIYPLAIMMTTTTFILVKDAVEGRLTTDFSSPKKAPEEADTLVAPDVQGSCRGQQGLSFLEQLKLIVKIMSDYLNGAVMTMIFYTLPPCAMATWSIMINKGSGFLYIAAAKPA